MFTHIYKYLLVVIAATGPLTAGADVEVSKTLTFKFSQPQKLLDNHGYAAFVSDGKAAYNMRGFELLHPGGELRSLKVNPAGYSFATLSGKGKKFKVTVAPVNATKKVKTVLDGLTSPSAIAYTPDSRRLVVADDGRLKFFDSKTLVREQREIALSGSPSELAMSPNGYFAAAIYPGRVDIINLSDGTLRTTLPTEGVPAVAFSPSSARLAIIDGSATLRIFTTADFMTEKSIQGITDAATVFFHPDENYVGYTAEGNRVQFVNLFDLSDRPAVYSAGVSAARFLTDGHGNLYLADLTPQALHYRLTAGFTPNYGNLLNQMVEQRLNEWMKMRPGETELEFRERVNAESIALQRSMFANEAATELALTAGLGAFGDAVLGNYNPTTGTLVISLGGMPDIYLTVPQEDMAGFGDGNNLQYNNPVFSVTPANTFELIYVSVFNPTNGKTYVFDNLDKQNLDFLTAGDGFVSLDLIMQSSREDVLLNNIKDSILKDAKAKRVLSDYTTIDVNTNIIPTVNAAGQRIRNYRVDFTYNVAPRGSATEDFAPGRYKIADSHAAESMLKIIAQAFADEFAGYLQPGKELIIDITGSADALPIRGALAYDGNLGEFTDEPCYINNSLTTLTVTRATGISDNEQLAFMRAVAVKSELEKQMPALNGMKVTFRPHIEVAESAGAQYRRISVSLVFVDAF